MNLFTRLKIIGPIGLCIAAAGGTATAAPAAEPESCEPASPAVCEGAACSEAADSQGERGAFDLVGEAISKVCLTDVQRSAIAQIGTQVAPKEQAAADSRHAFLMDLAEQIKSGDVNESALKNPIDALVKARQEASPVLRKAIEDIHALLDEGQRTALADEVQSRSKELADASGEWFEGIAKDLGLSSDQRDRIQTLLAKEKPELLDERATTSAAFAAFKGKDFSVEKIEPMAQVGQQTRAMAEGLAGIAKQLAVILTPEQRANLAQKIEAKDEPHAASAGSIGNEPEHIGTTMEPFIARGFRAGFRFGGVGSWGRGFYSPRAAFAGRRYGYGAGFPIVGGYGPGIW